eukprot:Blabericola_migrator_1__2761@NODE_178_length_11905_cov_212_545362_g155_i0_p8_GENE_NODE_178_length_11905_cov_212_545362_g155_i0NODE_178_length_11905_cov_212_545362_g155_i0_p8_ORF_typecomplete_len126_score8_40PEPcase/PF00311_17/0_051_NODE_178_length_11905_cov_212_545362_g155_i064566833
MMQLRFFLLFFQVVSIQGGLVLDTADHLYTTLTGRPANHTIPMQFLGAADSLARESASRFLANLENRRRANAAVIQNNVGGLVRAAEQMKHSMENTYVGAGLFSAAQAVRDVLRTPLLAQAAGSQ